MLFMQCFFACTTELMGRGVKDEQESLHVEVETVANVT